MKYKIKFNRVEPLNSLVDDMKIPKRISLLKLYDSYSSHLFAHILKIIPDKEKSENILQTVFVTLSRNIETYNTKDRLLLYLLNMARNEAIQTLILNDSMNNPLFFPQTTNIITFITKLPLLEKTILALIYFRGFTTKQIAELLGIPLKIIEFKLESQLEKLPKTISNSSIPNTLRKISTPYNFTEV